MTSNIKIGDVARLFMRQPSNQMTVEFKLLQVPLWPSTINQSPYHNRKVKGPEIQNVKLYIKHDNRPNPMKNG